MVTERERVGEREIKRDKDTSTVRMGEREKDRSTDRSGRERQRERDMVGKIETQAGVGERER